MSNQVTPGQEYGLLTVVNFSGMRSNHAYYKCRCRCGIEIEVRSTRLRSGKKNACVKCAAATRKVGTYISSYRVVDFLRSEITNYIVECIVCRRKYTVPWSELRRISTCVCQTQRAERISSGEIDGDLLNQII